MSNKKNKPYGQELVLDLHGCNTTLFNRRGLTFFLQGLCTRIDMQPEDMYFWDDVGVSADEVQTDPLTKGTSAILFILTSSIVIHTLDLTGKVFINIFSCKTFDVVEAEKFCVRFFAGTVVARTTIVRH